MKKIGRLLILGLATAVLAIPAGNTNGQIPVDKLEITPTRVVPPIYPAVALAAGISGTVVVEIAIDPDGAVKSARSVSGPRLLEDVANAAATRWKFNSTPSTGARTARLVFDFVRLTGDPPSAPVVPIFFPPFTVEINGIKTEIIARKDSDPPSKEILKIVGLSVAYNLWPPRSRHLGPNRRDYDLIVKVISVLSGTERAKYIRMKYRHSKDDPELPSYFNNGKSWWLLPLVREPDCDQALTFEIPVVSRDGVVSRVFPAFQRPPGTESEPLATSVMPCYVLESDRVSRQRN